MIKLLIKLLTVFTFLAALWAADGLSNDVALRQPRAGAGTSFVAQKQREKLALEFVVLANRVDDDKAIQDMRKYFADPANKAEIEKCQKDGLPPPGPHMPGGPNLTTYLLHLAGGPNPRAKQDIADATKELDAAEDEKAERAALAKLEAAIQRMKIQLASRAKEDNKSLVTYRWVEIGAKGLRLLDLDHAAESDPKRDSTWKQAKTARDQGLAASLQHPERIRVVPLLRGALFYSRECQDRNLSDEERKKKKVEYFVLARNPEIDRNDAEMKKETPAIGSNFIISATASKSADNRPAVDLRLNKEGARLFAVLTRKNKTRDGGDDARDPVRRHLATVLDGQMIAAPTILSEIANGRAMISGDFTQAEVDDLAAKLRPKKR